MQRQEGSIDLSDLSFNRWLDDAAMVTVVVVVTDIDVSSTFAELWEDPKEDGKTRLMNFSSKKKLKPRQEMK